MSPGSTGLAESRPSIGELATFFVLTYAFSWWPFALGQQVLLSHGPSIAAVIVVVGIAGRNAAWEFWGRLTTFRAGWWYLIGPAVVLAYNAVAFFSLEVAGVPMSQPPSLTWSTALILLVLGGQWEELGWMGYALPRLRRYFAALPDPLLTAAIVLGLFRALWHLPLVLSGAVYWFDMIFLAMAMQLIMTWIYHRSGGSVPAVFVFHYASNLMGATMGPVYEGGHHVAYFATFIAVASIIAILVSIPRGRQSVE